jgi:hypothetical protein
LAAYGNEEIALPAFSQLKETRSGGNAFNDLPGLGHGLSILSAGIG